MLSVFQQAPVIDAYSKNIVEYDLSTRLSVKGAIKALNMGLNQCAYKSEKLIHYSDRGFVILMSIHLSFMLLLILILKQTIKLNTFIIVIQS
jgi:hypothetical protein